ncbi:methyltransferase domain-containing protein [Rhodobacteraceae bacterium NNCM2]|nr:methyltransferase domain-containing protein [Coraliihabitans acroporae]
MHLDVIDLRKFYYTTGLGRMTQRVLRQRLRGMWENVSGHTLVGFGFAAPFLRPFMTEAARTLCFMPAQQGVCPWPAEGPNVAALVEETRWPVTTGSVDRLIVAHGLETCERPQALLAEIWRVLAPGGKAIFMVPNRAGLWARRDGTPFGYGRPYSVGQLEDALSGHNFSADRHEAALYLPPSHKRFWLRLAPWIEQMGQRIDAQRFGGVALVEVTKMVYIAPKSGAAPVRAPLRVLEGLRPTPAPKPASGRTVRLVDPSND